MLPVFLECGRKYSKYKKILPFCGGARVYSHLLYLQFLNYNDLVERELGLYFGNVLMSHFTEVWVFGETISSGMDAEIRRAKNESEIERMQDTIDHIVNTRNVVAAKKRKEKLQKQLKECREYDEKIAHLALSRIELDLDDSVKELLRRVFDRYGCLSPWKLSALSHEEFSWKMARSGLHYGDNGDVALSLAAMKVDAQRELMNRK